MRMEKLPTIVIGAGPVGLAAASHLHENNQRFIIIEKGEQPGDNVLSWGHVQLFSPWKYNINQAAKRLLKQTEWVEPEGDKLPTGKELVDEYLEPLANLRPIKENSLYGAEVIAITKKNMDKMKSQSREETPFVLYIKVNGKVETITAKSVIDTSGTWSNPNSPYADGLWRTDKTRIHTHIPEINQKVETFKNKHVAIIGSGHSAQNTLIDLSKLKEEFPETRITWILRKKHVQEAFGGEERDELAARGQLGSKAHQLVNNGMVNVYTNYFVEDIEEIDGTFIITSSDGTKIDEVDEIIANTGSRPDFSFLSEIRLDIDPVVESTRALAPLIDPNLHSCGTVRPHGEKELRQPEPGFYIAGVKSYGRAPTFLMATGYEQVRSIVSYLSGDYEASEKVELTLPETGVCSTNLSAKPLKIIGVNSSSCC